MQYIVDHINKSVSSGWVYNHYYKVPFSVKKDRLKVPLVPLKQGLQPIPSTFHELLQWGDKAREQDKLRSVAPLHGAKQDVFHPCQLVFLAQI